MISVTSPLFETGVVVATRGATYELERAGQSVWPFVSRHVSGDWGNDLTDGDKELNNEALKNGSRLLSVYSLRNGEKIWIITEALGGNGKRNSTTILLPDEY